MTEVVAALIWEKDRFMICRRPAHKARGLLWEFVGGKVECGETREQALERECREELDVKVEVGREFMSVTHEYPDITVHLTLFHAAIKEGSPKLLEHCDLKWITPSEIPQYDFCPADEEILEKLIMAYPTARRSQSLTARVATPNDMAGIYDLRLEVFVKEQHVPPEIELDEEDACAVHFLVEENGVTVGCARVIATGREAHVGRLAVRKDRRGKGIGAFMSRFVIDYCRERGYTHIWLNSQLHAVRFYEKLGFIAQGEHFMEAGIEHIRMVSEREYAE